MGAVAEGGTRPSAGRVAGDRAGTETSVPEPPFVDSALAVIVGAGEALGSRAFTVVPVGAGNVGVDELVVGMDAGAVEASVASAREALLGSWGIGAADGAIEIRVDSVDPRIAGWAVVGRSIGVVSAAPEVGSATAAWVDVSGSRASAARWAATGGRLDGVVAGDGAAACVVDGTSLASSPGMLAGTTIAAAAGERVTGSTVRPAVCTGVDRAGTGAMSGCSSDLPSTVAAAAGSAAGVRVFGVASARVGGVGSAIGELTLDGASSRSMLTGARASS